MAAEQRTCPDDAACHHGCGKHCWRVLTCAPLSSYGEHWGSSVIAANTPGLDEPTRVEDIILGRASAPRTTPDP